MSASDYPLIEAAGDGALLVALGARMDVELSRRVVALSRAVAAAELPGVTEAVPGIASLTVHLDPDRADADRLIVELSALTRRAMSEETVAGPPPRRWIIPVCYDPDLAPDLGEVADRSGLAPADVVARHTSADYHVYMVGFLPGFPYMGDLDPALRLPRRATPRTSVPRGAVAIAGAMTAIYPLESPGGWHLIGATPAPLFDAAARPPALLAAGDRVRFRAVPRDVFAEMAAEAATGGWRLEPEPSPAEPRT